MHTQGVKKGNIVNIDKLIPIINTCIGQAEDEIKSEIQKLYVSINSSQFKQFGLCQTRNIALFTKLIMKKDVQNLINNAVNIFQLNNKNQKIIHLFNSCFKLDKNNIVENPTNLKAESLESEVGIVSIDNNLIENYKSVLEKCHLSVEKFFYSPFCIGDFIFRPGRI